MLRTAARLAVIAAAALTAAPAAAHATITLENVMVSSAQPAATHAYKMQDVFVSSAQPQRLPAVQTIREAAGR